MKAHGAEQKEVKKTAHQQKKEKSTLGIEPCRDVHGVKATCSLSFLHDTNQIDMYLQDSPSEGVMAITNKDGDNRVYFRFWYINSNMLALGL